MTTKNLSEETEQKIVNHNPIKVKTFLDCHRLAILFFQWTFMGGYLNCIDVFVCSNLKQIEIYI